MAGHYAYGRKDLAQLLDTDSEESADNNDGQTTHEEKGTSFHILQQSLPDHLKGKRTRNMSKEEKMEYNTHRKNLKRGNNVKVKVAIFDDKQEDYFRIDDNIKQFDPINQNKTNDEKKEKNRRRKQLSRKRETITHQEERRSKDAKAKAAKKKETLMEQRKRKEADAKNTAVRRGNETQLEQRKR